MTRLLSALGPLLVAAGLSAAEPVPVILDTDIGSDIDDAYALALALASPELDLRAVTTVGSQSMDRAWIVCRFLAHSGHKATPVAAGADPQPESPIDWQIQYRRHPAPIFNRTQKPGKETAVELMHRLLAAEPGKLTLICVGPLTNVARLLKDHPDDGKLIKRIVVMGGSIEVGYEGKKGAEPEWNIKTDIPAAKAVFESGVPLTVVPLDATATLALKKPQLDRLFSARTQLTFQLQTLHELWDRETPILFDPAAIAAVANDSQFTWANVSLQITEKGMTERFKGGTTARVATGSKPEEFAKWYVEKVRGVGEEVLPTLPKNLSKLVERGNFPARVHVFEDYNTDIEKRWWMTGKAETKDVPEGGVRCNRAVLTQDFDDRQGQLKTSYRAVIFNPVPGPPMGPNTRLTFRYKLSGTDRLRVQLYSLTNGYHRYLSLEKVENDRWLTGTVDMTAMRKPDGTGGPLAADERIDDIQFYVDPRAHLLIDDVMLYDAAADGEKRPFPKRVYFTGWFDTGKQGQEWPGDFEIVPHEKPLAWKHAKSVENPATKTPWLRVSMRGVRELAQAVELSFRYRLTGGEVFAVSVWNSKTGQLQAAEVKGDGEWRTTTVKFEFPRMGAPPSADEIRFTLPKGATLQVDDVLLYEP